MMWHSDSLLVSLSVLKLNDFYLFIFIMLQTLIQRYDKNHFYPIQKRETVWNFKGCQIPHFMALLILYIDLLNLFWIKKFLYGVFKSLQYPLLSVLLSCRNISLVTQNEFESATVNKPTVFEPLKFYCILIVRIGGWVISLGMDPTCKPSSLVQVIMWTSTCNAYPHVPL